MKGLQADRMEPSHRAVSISLCRALLCCNGSMDQMEENFTCPVCAPCFC